MCVYSRPGPGLLSPVCGKVLVFSRVRSVSYVLEGLVTKGSTYLLFLPQVGM